MKKIIFKYLELAIIVSSAISVWWLAYKLYSVSYLNNWGWIILFISIFFVAWSLGAIIIRDKKIFLGTTFLALFSQIIFVRSWGLFFVILFSFFVLWFTRRVIRKEIKSRLKINIWMSLKVGGRFFVLVIALMLAGQYYFFENPQIESGNLPKFKVNNDRDGFIVKIITLTDINLLNKNGDLATVDEFVFEKFKEKDIYLKNIGEISGGEDQNFLRAEDLSDYQKDIILAGGKEDISKMAEREVDGEEKMVDVFLEILNKKIDDFLNLNVGYVDQDMPVMHLVFSLVIFLAISGTGMIINFILILLVAIIFRFLVWINLLSVDKKAVNMEIIKIG